MSLIISKASDLSVPAPEPDKLNTYTPESVELEFSGTGLGNKTIGSICKRLGLGHNDCRNKAHRRGRTAEYESEYETRRQ